MLEKLSYHIKARWGLVPQKEALSPLFKFMEFETTRERNFWLHQIKQDDKAIAQIEQAGKRGDAKEIQRAEKRWRKQEAMDRRNFNRGN